MPHDLSTAHSVVHVPPQSTSPSEPFLMPSVHVAATQLPLGQATEAQSSGVVHVFPVPQAGQIPPQSTSLSVPFFVPSVQPVAT
jgi:hypothetical protein